MSTQPDPTRQAFEAWAKTEEKLSIARSNLPKPVRYYTQIDTEWAFSGWVAAIAQATAAERERCAKVCDEIAANARVAYKTSKEPGVRYDPHVDGLSDGAVDCSEAIRKGEALEGEQLTVATDLQTTSGTRFTRTGSIM